ncbi:MAG: hypothetical protein IPP25_05350 [Saprospiraceae bacterium]|nr:hypothetical protein [Candidatus Opimibacter skivensis]
MKQDRRARPLLSHFGHANNRNSGYADPTGLLVVGDYLYFNTEGVTLFPYARSFRINLINPTPSSNRF